MEQPPCLLSHLKNGHAFMRLPVMEETSRPPAQTGGHFIEKVQNVDR
jgi:hypothetical protein